MADRQGRKRLSIDLPEGIYKEIKMLAVMYNITVTKYVIRALLERFKNEKRYGLIEKDHDE